MGLTDCPLGCGERVTSYAAHERECYVALEMRTDVAEFLIYWQLRAGVEDPPSGACGERALRRY